MAEKKQDEGQVSEVSGLRNPDEQVSDGDSVAGQSDQVDEGPTGPDAVTFAERKDEYPEKGDTETTG